MAEKTPKKETTIASFPFLPNDSSWSGAVEVVERTVTSPATGEVRVFSDLRLRFDGRPPIPLPRRGLTEIIAALQKAQGGATEHYNRLIRQANAED